MRLPQAEWWIGSHRAERQEQAVRGILLLLRNTDDSPKEPSLTAVRTPENHRCHPF
ncbi:MAG: hypothetical protein HQ582_10990 [Planctomycetes bacterium]|nr:hypothetical protein [Planctomycetota bacterium]